MGGHNICKSAFEAGVGCRSGGGVEKVTDNSWMQESPYCSTDIRWRGLGGTLLLAGILRDEGNAKTMVVIVV